MKNDMDAPDTLLTDLSARRYGKYRAFVTDNEDPEKRCRLRLRIPSALGEEESGWALPCLPFGGGAGYGWLAVPEKEAQVWAEFEEGDINRPIWTGVFWQKEADIHSEAAKAPPTTRLLATPAGHLLQFDDGKDEERVRLHHASQAELVIDAQGRVVVNDAAGATLTMDAEDKKILIEDANRNVLLLNADGIMVEDSQGNCIELRATGVTIKAQQVVIQGGQVMLGGQGGEQLVKGASFMSIFNSHVHACSPGGPSGPPVPLMTPAVLSAKVTTS